MSSYWTIRRKTQIYTENILQAMNNNSGQEERSGNTADSDNFILNPVPNTCVTIGLCNNYNVEELSEDSTAHTVPLDVCDGAENNESSSENHKPESNSSNNTDVDDDVDFSTTLGCWAVQHHISHAALKDLMSILSKSSQLKQLPKDPRTLLHTPRGTLKNIKNIQGGEFYYFGIENVLLTLADRYAQSLLCKDTLFSAVKEIGLVINVDGLPIHKSTSKQFWPILIQARFNNNNEEAGNPFIAGLFVGDCKPLNVDEYLSDLIEELNHLLVNGIHYKSAVIKVVILFFVCDSPARQFIKSIKSHSGYSGCDHCTDRGVYRGKITFPSTTSPLRNDENFRAMMDDDHHKSESPLTHLPINMISQFPLDPMHLLYLGIMRKLLALWFKGPLNVRIGFRTKLELSENLISLQQCMPSEFARKPRSLIEMDRFKATELRALLLYTGPVVLKDHLHPAIFDNFMILSISIRILSCPVLCKSYMSFVEDILKKFVEHFGQLYGGEHLVYNVHCLIH